MLSQMRELELVDDDTPPKETQEYEIPIASGRKTTIAESRRRETIELFQDDDDTEDRFSVLAAHRQGDDTALQAI